MTPVLQTHQPTVAGRHKSLLHTDTSSDQHSNLDIEDILGGCTIWSIDTDSGQRTRARSRIKFDEIATSSIDGFVLLLTLHGSGCKLSNDSGTCTETFTKTIGPITNLTDVDGDIWILWSRSDSELWPKQASAKCPKHVTPINLQDATANQTHRAPG